MNSKNLRKVVSMVLVVLMSFSSMVFATGGDYLGHWAEDSIQSWIDKGYVKGYVDGSFGPENDITRAEFISIVNRSFGFAEEAEVTFKDVAHTHWAYNEFKVASAAGYIGGFEDGTVQPNSKITRQEMASIITRLLNLNAAKDSDAYLGLDDVDAIPEWSAGAISALVSKGYIRLRDGNSFAPALPATRAEVIDALNNGYLSVTKVKYDEAGTYTAGVVDGSVEINAKDVILEDTTINGDLIIGEGVADGDVTLENVVVKGNTIVKGGGMNSIIVVNSKLRNLIVEKKDGKVRILAKGDTFITNVEMKSGGKLESDDKDTENFGYVVIAENLLSDEPIILAGNFDNVEVKSGKNEIKVTSGTIKNLVISKTAKNAKIDLAEGVKIEKLEVNAVAKIEGKGKIDKAVVNVDGVAITVPVEKIETADDVKKPETSKPSTGGGGSSDTGSGSENDNTALTIKSVNASNGTVIVKMSKSQDVDRERFTIYQKIGEGETSIVKPTDSPGSNNVFTFTIPKVDQTDIEQSVVISVSLDKAKAVVADAYIVKAKDEEVDKKDETYTVTFDSKGGSKVAEITGITTNTAIELPTPPTKEGYSFKGWFMDEVFENEFTKDTKITKDITVYAKWVKDETKEFIATASAMLLIFEDKTTGAAITFTEGRKLNITTDTAITFELSESENLTITSDTAINLSIKNESSSNNFVYKLGRMQDNLPKNTMKDTLGDTQKVSPMLPKISETQYLTIYEIALDGKVLSYININIVINRQ